MDKVIKWINWFIGVGQDNNINDEVQKWKKF